MVTIPKHPHKPISRPFTKREKKHIIFMSIFAAGTLLLFALLLHNPGAKAGHATQKFVISPPEGAIPADTIDFSRCGFGNADIMEGKSCYEVCEAMGLECAFALENIKYNPDAVKVEEFWEGELKTVSFQTCDKVTTHDGHSGFFYQCLCC